MQVPGTQWHCDRSFLLTIAYTNTLSDMTLLRPISAGYCRVKGSVQARWVMLPYPGVQLVVWEA